MGWTAADMPDLTGKVAVVTGGNGGLGLETTRELARRGASVVMAARSREKADRAYADILGMVPEAAVAIVELDLSSLASIAAATRKIIGEHIKVDFLFNNAGVMATPELQTADGFELQFGTNHLGHFAFTAQLIPALLRSAGASIVTTTSIARLSRGTLNSDDPHSRLSYDPWTAYSISKLANLRFALELNRRLSAAGAGVKSLVAHPGLSRTELQAQSVEATGGGRSQRGGHWMARNLGMSAAEGALPQLRAATDPDSQGGEYYGPRWGFTGVPVRRHIASWYRKPEDMTTLWNVSERETGVPFDVDAMVKEYRP